MKTLNFTFRGESYQVNEKGHISTRNSRQFSDKWIFLGGTKHHWSNTITIPLATAFKDPKLLNGCLGFDKDHGTTRQWNGRYNGRLPRITNVYVN